MIISEFKDVDGMMFMHNYSDQNMMIRNVDTLEVYSQAWDNIKYKDIRKYEETDIPIPDLDPYL